jgi:cobalt-zinc-cadmium resistance protein CzcA
MDSLYSNFSNAAQRKFELGESNYLEMITSKAKYKQYSLQLNQLKNDILIAYQTLKQLLQKDEDFEISTSELHKITIEEQQLENHLINKYYTENSKLFKAQKGLEMQQLLPDLHFNYFRSEDVSTNNSVNSFQAGITIPLAFWGKSSKIAAKKIAYDIAQEESLEANFKLKSKYAILMEELQKNEAQLTYFNENGNTIASAILKTATASYKNGEIDFFQYIQSIENANQLQIDYLMYLNAYNQIALEINYLNL